MTEKSIHGNFDKATHAMNVINDAQQRIWELHHAVRKLDEKLGNDIWECTLQIESALGKLNEEMFAGSGYWENK